MVATAALISCQSNRRTKSSIATWSARRHPRGRRGMRPIVVAVLCALSASVAVPRKAMNAHRGWYGCAGFCPA